MRRLQYFVLLCCVAALTLLGGHAYAQSSASLVSELSKEAMQEYDFMEFAAAEEKISQAIAIIEKEGIKEAYTAQVFLAQAIISYGYLKDSAKAIAEEKAFNSFVRAVAINRDVQIPADYRSNELEVILERARNTVGTTSVASIVKEPEVIHTGISSTQPCKPLTVEAIVPVHPDVYRIKLYYLSDSDKEYRSIDMTPSIQEPSLFSATIPSSETDAKQIKYYIEALNRQNQAVASVASYAEPFITVTVGECEKEDLGYGDPIFQLSAVVGTGFGVVKGMTENCHKDTRCQKNEGPVFQGVGLGVASVPLFVRADLVFNLPKSFQVGAYARIQIIDFAYMFGGLVRYVFLNQPHRLYLGVLGGWGDATAKINLGPKFQNFTDVYRLKGSGHAGLQFGFMWSFHKNIGFVVDLTALVHFPTKVNFQAEVAIGPFIQF